MVKFSDVVNSLQSSVGSASSMFKVPFGDESSSALSKIGDLSSLSDLLDVPNLSSIGTQLSGMISTAQSSASNILSNLPTNLGILNSYQNVRQQVASADGDVLAPFDPCSAISGTFGAISQMKSQISNAISSIGGFVDSIQSHMQPIIDQVSSFVGQALSSVTDLIGLVKNSATEFISAIKDEISSIVGSVQSAISDAVNNLTDAINAAISNVTDVIESLSFDISNAVEYIKSFNFANTLESMFRSMNPCARDALNDVIRPEKIPTSWTA